MRNAIGGVLAVLLLGGLVGCGLFDDHDDGFTGPRRNIRPNVSLEAVPPVGDTTRYVVELTWTAWDVDGEVDHFLYSIDPPDTAGAETLWVKTEAYSATIVFTADQYDTTTIDDPWSDWKQSQIAVGYHEFVIVAVDDRGAVSAPDYLAFNSSTICPVTWITSPPPVTGWNMYMGAPQHVGVRVTFRWEGEDPDGVFSDEPVGYMYKLKKLPDFVVSWRDIADYLYYDQAPWKQIGPDTTHVTLDLEDRRSYGFGVRAIDEAGAVEPLLVLNRNLLWVRASESSSYPELTVKSAAFGQRRWTGWRIDKETYEVPQGSAYELSISGNAGWYGGLITGYSFAWDLTDLDTQETHPQGIGAWTPWSATPPTIVAQFEDRWDRYLYIKCKDDLEVMTLALIHFDVVKLAATKNLGYIDDCRMYPSGSGEAHDDGFWQGMLAGYDYGRDWADLTWDEWDAPFREEVPSLEFLSQFKVLVWSICDRRETAPDSKSAWYQMNYVNTAHSLALYLGLEVQDGWKGKLWAFGDGMVESCVMPYGGPMCKYPYSVLEKASATSCYIRRNSFAYDYLHIRGDYSRDDPAGGGARVNRFSGSDDRLSYVYVNPDDLPMPGYGQPSAAVLYPDLPPRLEPDLAKWRASAMLWFEVMEYPGQEQETQLLFFNPLLGRQTGLVPIYRYRATTENSRADGKYCGFRYMPQSAYDHGEIVYFFFPMYPMFDDQARATAKVVLSDWFGLADPDAADTK